MWGGPLDVFLSFEFRVDRSPNFGATGVKNRPFPLTKHIAYTTVCCYRTSRDLLTILLYFLYLTESHTDQWPVTTDTENLAMSRHETEAYESTSVACSSLWLRELHTPEQAMKGYRLSKCEDSARYYTCFKTVKTVMDCKAYKWLATG